MKPNTTLFASGAYKSGTQFSSKKVKRKTDKLLLALISRTRYTLIGGDEKLPCSRCLAAHKKWLLSHMIGISESSSEKIRIFDTHLPLKTYKYHSNLFGHYLCTFLV